MRFIVYLLDAYRHFVAMREHAQEYSLERTYLAGYALVVGLFILFTILFSKVMLFMEEESITALVFAYTFAPALLLLPASKWLLRTESEINRRLLDAAPIQQQGDSTCVYFRSFQVDRFERLRLIQHSEGHVREAATQVGLVTRSFGASRYVGTVAMQIEHDDWLVEVKTIAAAARIIVICPIATRSTMLEIQAALPHHIEKTLFLMPSDPREYAWRDPIGVFVKWAASWISFVLLKILTKRDFGTDLTYSVFAGKPMSQLWGWSRAKLKKSSIHLPAYSEDGGIFQFREDGICGFVPIKLWEFDELQAAMEELVGDELGVSTSLSHEENSSLS